MLGRKETLSAPATNSLERTVWHCSKDQWLRTQRRDDLRTIYLPSYRHGRIPWGITRPMWRSQSHPLGQQQWCWPHGLSCLVKHSHCLALALWIVSLYGTCRSLSWLCLSRISTRSCSSSTVPWSRSFSSKVALSRCSNSRFRSDSILIWKDREPLGGVEFYLVEYRRD